MKTMIEQRKTNRGQGGFTLIELLVVIAILAVLAGVAVFAVGNLTDTADENACTLEKDTIDNAILAYKTANDGQYPSDASFESGTGVGLERTPKYFTLSYDATGATAPTMTKTATAPAGC